MTEKAKCWIWKRRGRRTYFDRFSEAPYILVTEIDPFCVCEGRSRASAARSAPVGADSSRGGRGEGEGARSGDATMGDLGGFGVFG